MQTITTEQQAVIAFLKQDLLRNIVPLKMLAAYPAVIKTHYYESGADAAALLLFPTSAFAYDRATYPDLDLVVLLSATTADAAAMLLPYIPPQQKLIFKLMDASMRNLLAEHFALQRVTAFLSYTATQIDAFTPHADVVVADQVDKRLYPYFADQGHDQAELSRYFAGGQARAFTLYQVREPVAACFTYQNFETVHEIGGVFTLPSARRKGYAQKVVETAVHSLLTRGCFPRYQVHEINRPSIALAAQIGLTPFVTVEHWRYTPVPPDGIPGFSVQGSAVGTLDRSMPRKEPMTYIILRATPDDAERLREVAVVAKGYWNYTPEWMARWEQLFQVKHDDIEQHQVYKMQYGDIIVGWYSVILHGTTALLDDLWVEPAHIGKGVGRMLFDHARQTAQSIGARRLELEADPNAVGFYQHMGATIVGKVNSAMGRKLPIMELRL